MPHAVCRCRQKWLSVTTGVSPATVPMAAAGSNGDDFMSLVRSLEEIGDDMIDQTFGKTRQDTRERAPKRLNSGHICTESLRARKITSCERTPGVVVMCTVVPSLKDTVKHVANDTRTAVKPCFSYNAREQTSIQK